jgi:hypothetical protein
MASNKPRGFRPSLEALENRLQMSNLPFRFGTLPQVVFTGTPPANLQRFLIRPLPPQPIQVPPRPNHLPPVIFNPTKLETGLQVSAFNPTKLETGVPIPGYAFSPSQPSTPANPGGLTVIYM